MKIGILTFHWATNYGAVLQCYALQTYLESKGHDVKVINYKPRLYDDNLYSFIRFRKFFNISEYLHERKKESALLSFRNSNLNQTERVYSCSEMEFVASQFDVIISGSDQVVNPSFLLSGEGKGVLTPTYFLGFPFKGKRVGYALSFGCVTYPEELLPIAQGYIKEFDILTVRENTGVRIVDSMGRNDAIVVPDPTLLMMPQFYHTLADKCSTLFNGHYIYSFFIRNIKSRKQVINKRFKLAKVLWNNEDGDYSMQGWLYKIKNADFVITDSFHCVVMCLKLHKPFFVVTEYNGNVGMNDRLYSLLEKLSLDHLIVHKTKISDLNENISMDWLKIDEIISSNNKVVDNVFD